jgi:hypothetical protein
MYELMRASRIFAYIIVGVILFCVITTVCLLPYWALGIIAFVSVLKEFLDDKFDFSNKADKWTKKVIGLHLSTIMLLIYIIIYVVYWSINK